MSDLVPHFSKHGYECPMNYNPSDFIMFLSQTEKLTDLRDKGVLMDTKPNQSKDESANNFSSADKQLVQPKAELLKQLYLLTNRELRNLIRDKGALIGRFGITIFLNILYGLIFFNAGGKDDSDPINFNTHFGALTMITISSMFGSAQPVMLMFPFERPMFLREYSTGSCKLIIHIILRSVYLLVL